MDIFDFQARAMGLHIANLAMALDPEFVVIGGGLMDAGATTAEFRERCESPTRLHDRNFGQPNSRNSKLCRPREATFHRQSARRWWHCTNMRKKRAVVSCQEKHIPYTVFHNSYCLSFLYRFGKTPWPAYA
jgi:hypothetical protein